MNFVEEYNKELKETVFKAKHKSGLSVILIKKPGFKKSYATFSTKYGSVNTEFVVPGESESTKVIDGIAHFLEHKVFEQPDGTNAFNQFSLYGANANAFTSFGVTNYLFSAADCFYENLEILLNFVQTPYFTEENVEKEKGIIAQEIKMYEDDAEQTCYYNCLEGMYYSHPVKTKIAGSVDEIMKTTPGLLYKCYNTFYHPSNMAVICVGDLDENKLGEIVEKCIDKEAPAGKITQVFPNEKKGSKEKRVETRFDIPMPMFMLGFKDSDEALNGEELLKRDILTTALLKTLFGKSSKLFARLYEKGIINKSFSAFYEYEDSCGYAAFSGDCPNPDEVAENIFLEIENAIKKGVNKDDFERAKKVLLGNFVSMLDSAENLGNEYMFAYHRGIDLFEYPRICKEITVVEAEDRLKQLFTKENSTLSVVLPKK